MKNNIYILVFLVISANAVAQDYNTTIENHRKEYMNDFLTYERSPLKEGDFPYIKFYAPDKSYNISADFALTPDAKQFDMATYSGITKKYIKYGILKFKVNGVAAELSIY